LFEGLEACFEIDKVELEIKVARQGFEDSAASWNDFLANSVAWDKACIKFN
jgi:hypothetical protein